MGNKSARANPKTIIQWRYVIAMKSISNAQTYYKWRNTTRTLLIGGGQNGNKTHIR